MTTDITELTSVQKNANIHRLSRLIAYASNDELRQMAVEVEIYTDRLIEALEKAKGMEDYWKTQCRGITDHCKELQARIAELESRTVTIEPFRSFVTDADLAALHRFAECCDDPESGGHDLEKEQVRRLEAIGALQSSGRISYITGFGDVLISITAGIKWEAE